MSGKEQNPPVFQFKPWLIPAAAAGVLVAAVISYGRTEERQAAPGSPYYDKAVKEAISGLLNGGATPAVAEGIPPLPAGLAAEDYYWCGTCKAYHKRDAAAQAPAAALPQAAKSAAEAIPPVAGGAAEAIPPLPANLSAADYYWCPNCKTYHARDSQAAAATPPPAWPGVPFPLPAAAVDQP